MDEKVDKALDVKKSIEQKPEIPPRARPVSQLEKVENTENEAQPSSNNVYQVKKRRLNDSSDKHLYYFKEYDNNDVMYEIESYCGTICRFIATEEYVPSTRPYVNAEKELVGVASKAFVNFKSNHEDPLKKEDTVIDAPVIKIEQAQRELTFAVKKALDNYIKKPTSSGGYLGSVQSIFHSFYDSSSTSHKTIQTLKDILNNPDKYSVSSLDTLLTAVSARVSYLKNTCSNQNEYRCLKPIQKLTTQLKSLYSTKHPQAITVEVLDKLDRLIKKEGLDLETCDKQIKRTIDGQVYRITTTDLKNYRTLKGQAVSLTTRLIFKEGDNNNSNMSKQGQIIDFGWTKANITYQFNKRDTFNRWIRRPSESSFALTPERMEYFPDAGDIHLFYWPTKQPDVHRIIIKDIAQILHRIANYQFEGEDDIAREITLLCIDLNHFLEKVPQNNTSYFETTVQLLYRVSVGFRALLSGRTPQGLLDEDKIKYTFAMLENQFKYFTMNEDRPGNYSVDGKILLNFENLRRQLQALKQFCFGLIDPIKLFYLQQRTSANNADEKQTEQKINEFTKSVQQLFDECTGLLSSLQTHMERYSRNSFSADDNEVYKSLATHPVFIFHKYKTLLKYILTNDDLYQAFIKLNITNREFNDETGEKVNLHDIFINDESIRIEELLDSLVETDDFKDFLDEHGSYAFQLIREEFEIEREKYSRKKNPDFDYKQLVDALDISRMEDAFVELCDLCGVDLPPVAFQAL